VILHSLRTKILILVGGVLLLAAIGIAYQAHSGMKDLIDRSQSQVYRDSLTHLLLTLEQYHDELQKTLRPEVYHSQFQQEALRVVRLNQLSRMTDDVYPFILDSTGRVLLHPVLGYGDESLSDEDFIQQMLHSPAGDFSYR